MLGAQIFKEKKKIKMTQKFKGCKLQFSLTLSSCILCVSNSFFCAILFYNFTVVYLYDIVFFFFKMCVKVMAF